MHDVISGSFVVIFSVRTTQHYLNKLNLQKRGVEDDQEEIRFAIQEELRESCRNLGVKQIWKIIRKKYGLLVKRHVQQNESGFIIPSLLINLSVRLHFHLRRLSQNLQGLDFIW